MRVRNLIATMMLAASSMSAAADGAIDKIITQADRARLKNYDTVRNEALAEAEKGGDAKEFAALQQTLTKPPLSYSDFDMTGDWQCRTTKVGGLLPLVVYSWFKCRVTDDGSGWMLEKLSGSQRTNGRFYTESDLRLTYLGAFYANDDPAPVYGAGAPSDQVGYAVRTGPAEWRIELPAPAFESKLDILEFRR